MGDRILISAAIGFVCLLLGWIIAALYVWLNQVVPFGYVLPLGIIAAIIVFTADVISEWRKR